MTALDQLNHDFHDLLSCFCTEEVEFVIVGAYALAFHGVPRATGDIDLFVRPSSENAARVTRALLAFGAPLDVAGITEKDFSVPGIVYQIGVPPRRIDVLTAISGLDFDAVWASKLSADLQGSSVHFIGKEALIANKRATGRTKDLADVESLER